MTPATEAALRVLADAQREGLVVRVGPRTMGGKRPTVSGQTTQALLAAGLITAEYEAGRRRGVYVLALVSKGTS